MKFDPKAKVWEAASKDKLRPVLTAVHLAIEGEGEDRKGFLEATDNYLLVRVPCEVSPEDVAGLIPVEALKEAAKGYGAGGLTCNGACTLADGRSWPRPEGQFPETKRLIAGYSENTASFGDEPCAFGINPALLVKAEKALGAKGLRVEVRNPLKPITLVGMGGVPGHEAIVMSIRLASS